MKSEKIKDNTILKYILNSLKDVVFFKDKDLKYQAVNESFLNYVGAEKYEDVVGKSDYEIFSKEVADNFIASNKEIIKSRSCSTYLSYCGVSKTAKKKAECQTTISPVFDDSNEFVGLIGYIQKLELDKEKENRERLIRKVFEYSNEGILITDGEQRITVANKTFLDMTGYQEEELLGLTPRDVFSQKYDEDFYMQIRKSLAQNGLWQGEIASYNKSGEEFLAYLTVTTIKDSFGNVINYIGMFFDVTKLKEAQLQLAYMSNYDSLTGLKNRVSLRYNLESAIKMAEKNAYMVGILYFDLDNFKEINDIFGHIVGDKILVQVAQRLKDEFENQDNLYRLEGDGFMVLIKNFALFGTLKQFVDKVFSIFKDEFILEDKTFTLTCSIGVSIYPSDGYDVDTLIKSADVAMYQSKKLGKNTYTLYSNDMTDTLLERVEIINDIRRGIKNNEFFLQYQPKINIKTDEIIGVEALVRWNHPKKGILYPDSFIPLAESNKLIIPLGKKILEMACKDIKHWMDTGVDLDKFKIAVNISAVQLTNDNLYQTVRDIIHKTGVLPKYLELEITETSIMKDSLEAVKLFKKFRDLSISLSIDDFGTGYSSLSYLKKFSKCNIKIDRSFIADIPRDKDDMTITKTILGLGESMGLDVIAEGIETNEQKEFLLKEGCQQAQGYLYSKPLNIEDLEQRFLKYR